MEKKEKRILSTLIEERFMVSGMEFDTFIKMVVSFLILLILFMVLSFVLYGQPSFGLIVLWLITCYIIKIGLTEYRRNLPTYVFVFRSIGRMFKSNKEEIVHLKGVSDGKNKTKK